MITYEVTATVSPSLAEAYERFMCERHIPDLLATNAFHAVTLARSAPGQYRIWYEVVDAETLDRYLTEHAPRLRAHFLAQFPDEIALSRDVWTTVQRWPALARSAASNV